MRTRHRNKIQKTMKKLILSIAMVAATATTMAQMPTAGENPFSLEGQLNLNNGTGETFASPVVRLRYFATDNISARLGVGFNSSNDEELFYGTVGTNYSDSIGTYNTKSSNYQIMIGGAYHFSQLANLSPYAGLDVMIGGGKTITEGEDTDGATWVPDYSERTELPTSSFGVNLVAGVDWYFAQNVFLGAELGFGFNKTTSKEGTFTATSGTTTVEGVAPSPGSFSSFGNVYTAGLRLGWRF